MGIKAFFYASVMALTIFATASSLANEPASFDCTKANGVDEKLICSDDLLAHVDRSLDGFYRTLLTVIPSPAKNDTKSEQIEWIKKRNIVCGITKNTKIDDVNRPFYVKCFLKSYGQRGEDLFDIINSVGIDEAASSHLQNLAENGDVDAQAVLGSIEKINQDKRGALLKKASKGGQLLVEKDFGKSLHVDMESIDDICNDGIDRLTEDEKTKILPLININNQPDSVGFNCRESNFKNHIIIGTKIGYRLGSIYSVDLGKETPEIKHIENGQYTPLEFVFDKTGAPFLLFTAEDLICTWDILANLRTGESQRLVEFFEDKQQGGCGHGWGYKESISSGGRFHLELRPDGLNNIVYSIWTMDCKTDRTATKTIRFVPTDKGFAPAK